MLNRIALTIAILIVPGLATAANEPLHARAIMQKMQAALVPSRASTRAIDIVITTREGESVHWAASESRKTVGGTSSLLTVFEAPDHVAGFAILTVEDADGRANQWGYIPFVRRVRKILYVEGQYQPFLGTDFTLADLGFVNLHAQDFTLVATEELGGKRAYKVRETAKAPTPYSSVVTWVATDSFLPLKREYYDGAGALWKTQHFENVTVIDGTPTPLDIRMVDEQHGSSTELRIREVRYDAQIPDSTFDPELLAAAAAKE